MTSLSAKADEYEGKLVSSIDISGNYPYIENKIRRYLTIRPGDPYVQTVIEEQNKRIKQFYKREGWHDTKVTTRLEHIPEYDSIAFHIKIHRGFLLRYKNINVLGEYSLPTSLVASKLNTWKPYSPRRLRESIHKITDVYRMNGFPLARVRLKKTEPDLENHTIDITVEIDEGPYVTVGFRGNEHLGGLQLEKVITIYTEGAIDTFELEESVKVLKERYKERGFPYAEITFKRKEIKKDRIHITFNIEEGKSVRIRNIFVEGNEEVSSRKVKDHMVSKPLSFTKRGIYDRKVLKNDVKRVDYFYRSIGFLDEVTESPYIEEVENGTQLNVIMPLFEGDQTIIKSIDFIGDIKLPEKKLLKTIKSKIDKPIDATIMDKEKERLVTLYADNGYPYVEVGLDVDRPSDTEANLNFNINPGPLVTFGDVKFVGDFLTSQKALRRALHFKPGDPFSYEKIVTSKISIRRLGAFATANIDPTGLEEKKIVIPLTIRVQELRPFKLDFDIGYSTDEKFIGSIDFTNRNSFGWAKRTIFRLTGGRKLSRGEIGWIDPRFLGYDLELSSNGWLQYEDKDIFSYIQWGAGVGLYRRYHRTSFVVRAALNRNYFLEGSTAAAADESLRNNTIISTGLSMSFDTRNNFAYPTKGLFIMGYLNFFDEIGGRDAHFVKFGLNNGLYFTFGERFTISNDLRFDNIQTFKKNTSVPSNELLLLGGDNSLRGFNRNSLGPVDALGRPTGGRLRFIDSTELRIGIFGNWKWIFFHDMGFLTNSYNAVNLTQLRHSAGFGLNYVTPIGPISAVYGFILDRRPGEHKGRFHLQFGYAF